MKTLFAVVLGICAVITLIFGIPLAGYAYSGFLDWISADPMHWLTTYNVVENPDVIKCRENGGYAIKSEWDGQLKECRRP